MRNFRAINLLQRVNYISKNSNLISKACLSSNRLLNLNKKSQNFETFSQSKRYSSSHDSHDKSGFTKTKIIYTLLGSALFGGIIAIYVVSSNEKKTKKTLTPTPQVQKAAPVEESTETESEDQPEEVASEEPKQEEPKLIQVKAEPIEVKREQAQDNAAKLDKEKFLPEIPSYAQYLIVGGGTAAMAAFKAIRANDANAKVLVVTEENYKPYMRPPLSKDLLLTEDENLISQLKFKQMSGNEKSLFYIEDEFYVPAKNLNEHEHGGVAVVTGKRVTQVDIENKTVRLDNNWEITYDKCLIATGGRPKNLPVFEKSWEKFKDKVTLFRNIDDFKRLYAIAKEGKTIAIVGGGFLGSELAYALANISKKNGGKVIQIFPEAGNLGRILPEYLSQWTTARVKEEGVTIIPKAIVSDAKINDNKIEINLDSAVKNEGPHAKWLLADHVIVAVGLDANVQLAAKSGFEIDKNLGGYLVNAELQARNSIWVAGDAACFYDIKLGRRRVEHHDHAVVSGRLAGENMTGAGKPYWHQSMFWSDLGPKIGFEAIGLVDSSLQTYGLFAKADENDTPQAAANDTSDSKKQDEKAVTNNLRTPEINKDDFGKGVILYVKNEQIVGVLLWNVFKKIAIARQLVQSQQKAGDYADIAKLFDLNATGLDETSGSSN